MVMRVAIAGATSKALGRYIARAFAERSEDFDVTLLIRQAALEKSKNLLDELTAAGANPATVDGKPPAELAKLLTGVDTVVSVVSDAGFPWQLELIEAARLAGVKTFVPSEFGIPLNVAKRGTINRLEAKYAARDALEASGMRPVYVSTGMFMEVALGKFLFGDWQSGQVKVHGRGESRFPLTSVHDIAAWLPDALLAPAPAKETYLVGNAVTWNDVVAACGEATGKSLDVTHVPAEALKAAASQPSTPESMMKVFGAQVMLLIDSGGLEDVQPSHPPGSKEPLTPLDYFRAHAQ